ncbi:MAG TPA: protein kinase, partial [Vicinamibacterales bacterium]|nr:protein kinase [Vicinamibacterales bacterium]
MGEVWKAQDTTLRREVAIKTLPEEFAKDPDRLARFEREATLLASLNHPGIAAIHGLEAHQGTRFLVLELVEGRTLTQSPGANPGSVEDALR